MNIKIGDDYLITSDSLNVVVNQRYEKKQDGAGTGEFNYKQLGFFGTLTQACNFILEREIKVSDAENLAELVETIFNIKNQIKSMTHIKEGETGE